MYRFQLANRRQIRPLKLTLAEVPHLTLEPSMICNLKCRCCYNSNRSYIKPLNDVKREIDFALGKRNLESISIVGGEPTLYPHLVDLVSYVKSKNLICQILTNGLILSRDAGDVLLDRLMKAGIDRIILHIDHGQGHTEEEMEQLCNVLFTKLEKRKIYFSLSITIYQENKTVLAEWLRKYAHYKYFDGVLTTQARHTNSTMTMDEHPSPDLNELYQHIERQLVIEPSSYIPSSIDDNEVSWLMFFYYINTNTYRTFSISPLFNRIFRRLYRLLAGRHVFAMAMDQKFFLLSFIFTCMIELVFKPARILSMLQLLRNSMWISALRFQYILMQSGPTYHSDRQKVSLCYHCPDATVRNGKITPVCLANQVSPLGTQFPMGKEDKELHTVVYEHMEEL